MTFAHNSIRRPGFSWRRYYLGDKAKEMCDKSSYVHKFPRTADNVCPGFVRSGRDELIYVYYVVNAGHCLRNQLNFLKGMLMPQ